MKKILGTYLSAFKAGIHTALDFAFTGTPRMMILRAAAVSVAVGIPAGLIFGGHLLLPVALGVTALGCIVTGTGFIFGATTALAGHHRRVFPKDRFKPLITAAQGTAACGMALLAGAIILTEYKKPARPVTSAQAAAARAFPAAPPAPQPLLVTPSSAVTAADLRR